MPKSSLKNPFARRKSSGNVLDIATPEAGAQSSFRVIERPEKSKIVLDAPDRRASYIPRPFNSPLQQLRGKSVDDLLYNSTGSVDTAASRRAATSLKPGRGSAGTTHSGSSDVYPSSTASGRYSSSSTLPSSIEHDTADREEEEEELFTKRRSQPQTAASSSSPLAARTEGTPLPPPPSLAVRAQSSPSITHIQEDSLPPPPSFSARASRAFSFGLRSKQAQRVDPPALSTNTSTFAEPLVRASTTTLPVLPPENSVESRPPIRERALTTSSYASTAVPLTLDIRSDFGNADFGGDFGSMFDNVGRSAAPPVIAASNPHRTDSPPIYPPKSYARGEHSASPNAERVALTASPSHDRHDTRDSFSDAAASPELLQAPNAGPAFFSPGKQGYATLPTTSHSPLDSASYHSGDDTIHAIRAPKSPDYPNRQSQLDDGNRWSKAQATTSARGGSASATPAKRDLTVSWDRESSNATPRAAKRESVAFEDDSLFDSSPVGPASLARRPVASDRAETAPKRLTKAQFDMLHRHGDQSDEATGGDSGDEYDDDDEVERAQQVTKQRRKQEANMAVYRQQMKRSTGGGPTDLPGRPNLERSSSSAPSLHLGGMPSAPPSDMLKPKMGGEEDDDDDVPLGILQAHGFPNGTRAPTRDDTPGYRPASVPARDSQNLPPFARRLPEDPYFGASLVSPTARESLAFSGAASAYGGRASAPPTMGGLVGVIVNEEQRRQSRRGSPNPITGTYEQTPLPINMPAMNTTSSMASMQAPSMFPGAMPGMPGMPMLSPGAMDNPQMQQFMQMQMQLMHNMQNVISMQQAQLAQVQQPQTGLPRPRSTASNMPFPQTPINDQGRAMSMVGPPNGNWNQPVPTMDPMISVYAPTMAGAGPGPGYTPSIAPSERSNVGMPSRYRPVQTGEGAGRTNSLTSSMTLNALQIQQENAGRPSMHQLPSSKSTIRIIDKPKGAVKVSSRQVNVDEDEESSWTEMFKKRAKGKKSDRASQMDGDRVALSELYPNVE